MGNETPPTPRLGWVNRFDYEIIFAIFWVSSEGQVVGALISHTLRKLYQVMLSYNCVLYVMNTKFYSVKNHSCQSALLADTIVFYQCFNLDSNVNTSTMAAV